MRKEIVDAAVAITLHARYVPNAICLTCRKHVYPEVHVIEGHEVARLTLVERDEVARLHKEAVAAQFRAYESYRRI